MRALSARLRATRPGQAALILAALLAVLLPGYAAACGIPLGARIPSEQALIVFAEGQEEIITSLHLQSERPDAAVVFPVPSDPQVTALTSDELFAYLERVTAPEIRTEEQLRWGDTDQLAGGAPPGVSLLGREVIGGYDVARLRADDPAALQGWLDENGYGLPPGAEPILRAYTDAGWRFVAVKLAGDTQVDGMLKPLRIAFESREIVYPMRLDGLADHSIDLLLYVLTDHRVTIPGMETQYAGPVAALDQPPPADLAPLFGAAYLTKLRNEQIDPATLNADFVASRTPSDEPFRQVITRVVYVNAWSRMSGPIIGLLLIIMLNVVAIVFAFGMRNRMRKIDHPPRDK